MITSPTTEVCFTAVSYLNNRTGRISTKIFWGFTQIHADTRRDEWRVRAYNCEILDEYVGSCQFQNLNQQLEYLD